MTRSALVAGFAGWLALSACGDDADGRGSNGPDDVDASASLSPPGVVPPGKDDGAGATGTPDAAAPSPASTPTIRCGGTRCLAIAPELAAIGATACCTTNDRCGVKTLLSPDVCVPRQAPGGADPSCPSFTASESFTWVGCCTAKGECGGLDATGTLGCVANDDLMRPSRTCDYDPANTCSRIIDVACDGNEDCTAGKTCCGLFDGAGYLRFTCGEDCAARESRTGDVWSEACHPGDACETKGFECLASPSYLPAPLYRCRDVGLTPRVTGSTAPNEVNCMSMTCSTSEKCCLSYPGPVGRCVPRTTPCSCALGAPGDDAGTDDAG